MSDRRRIWSNLPFVHRVCANDREEIAGAIRCYYGREPHDQEIELLLQKISGGGEMNECLINSAEFVEKYRMTLEPSPYLVPMVRKEDQIDCEASDAQLAQLLARIKGEWEEFGRTEPHWSVLTCDRFKQDYFASHEEEFFGSGAYVRDIVTSFLERQTIDPLSLESCFELGCGVGRITLHLADTFSTVMAADISQGHLSICKEELSKRQVRNVSLKLLDSPYSVRDMPEFDVFCSFIVLQHNPPPVMTFLLDTILGKLRPGGVAVFQLPTASLGYKFNLDHYLTEPLEPHMEMHVLPQHQLFRILARNSCQLREIREDGWAGSRHMCISNTVFATKDN